MYWIGNLGIDFKEEAVFKSDEIFALVIYNRVLVWSIIFVLKGFSFNQRVL